MITNTNTTYGASTSLSQVRFRAAWFLLILLPVSLVGSGCSTTGEPVNQPKMIESDVYTIEFREAMLELSEASWANGYSAYRDAQLRVVAELTRIRTELNQQRMNEREQDIHSRSPVLPRIMKIWNPIGYSIDDVKAALGEPTYNRPSELEYAEVYLRGGTTYILGTLGRRVVSVKFIPGE